MQKQVQPVKGSKDYYPQQKAFQNWLFEKARNICARFGYSEYEGPLLEHRKLYQAKSGSELVSKQAYQLKDKAGRQLIIRPELTPTLARMIAACEKQLNFPLRWFEIGQFWRYESPQKGRFREFYQWNVDLVGNTQVLADAEIITIACYFFKELDLGPSDVVIKISDRNLIQTQLAQIGIDKNKLKLVLAVIDKIDRVKSSEFESRLKKIGLTNSQIKNLNKILLDTNYQKSEWLSQLFDYLGNYQVDGYCQFDPKIVRGLDYYTSTVFEAFDKAGNFRAIAAGGRYDNLVADVGGGHLPGVGFGLGDAVIEIVLEKLGKLPNLNPVPTKVLITIFDQASAKNSLNLANILRQSKINCELYPEPVKLEKQLKYADINNIPYVAIVGPAEIKNNKISLKELKTQSQNTLDINQTISILKTK